MVCVNPAGSKVLTYGVTCMLEANGIELKEEGVEVSPTNKNFYGNTPPHLLRIASSRKENITRYM